ncbi:C-C motif chemokine 4 homolog [Rhineura floridana]|uniref:C-C motif chemokine 4 homolog n=1 Tax=Rhineura floridana TaxID=261503 RepID=UPI002AC87798|nr:C-C motif chemokine 4 homolog [Rhineura floridana]XP_061460724.1 C-C motif chemokine 4 homolog [Rhineura floridana]XP_061460725.1 C-C motif chemokine 4 homolog [Rhineura floridana]XP_061460726.1 C-C motif chemokine 4 homolog [Rhineura floridana]XP_061460727.1 C-C motif chemokine 4 homolog [Rhineura floridana]XP_061460728.1 C-C motif chemokine 4 homolog [Rhineura floridana]XP_061460729.1 C-C motif chemokine 4 homolog [Rhineura floridana]XP_061460730.1 C-C motif chemokine 4 homolog [Rhineur
MKVSLAAFALTATGLLVALCFSASAAPVGSDPPTSCCFSYTAKKIPRSYVADYYETNSRCSQSSIVFITRKGREICANPSEKWVQDYVNDLELH